MNKTSSRYARRTAVALITLFGFAIAAAADTAPPAPPAATPGAKADPIADAMKPCATGDDPVARAVACTNLIISGKLSGPALGAAYVFRGKAQAQRHELQAAIADFSEALKVNPQATDALYNRAAAYALMGHPDFALADFSHVLDLAPGDADTLFYRAQILISMGRKEDAISDLGAVLRLKPEDVDSRLQRAGLLIALGRNDDAIADLNQLLAKSPKAAAVLYNRGRAELMTGDNAAAAKDFAAAMQDRDNNPYAALRLYIANARMGKIDTAPLAATTKAFPPDQWPLPIVAFFQGQVSEADLTGATVSDPKAAAGLAAETQYYLGQWALLKRDPKAAAQHFQSALAARADPANLEVIDAGLELKKLKPGQ